MTHPGLGHEYETALAVSPVQKLLTYARGETVLTGMPAWAWRAVEDWVVPLAEGIGYKVREGSQCLGFVWYGSQWQASRMETSSSRRCLSWCDGRCKHHLAPVARE
jgi:hypothetical protein